MIIIYSAVFVLIVVFIFLSVITVKQQTAQIIEVFGKYHNVKYAGLRFKIPRPIGIVTGIIDLSIRELSRSVNVKSVDNTFLEFPVKVQYRVIPTRIKEAFYELSAPETQIISYIVNVVRGTASTMSMVELFQNKNTIEDSVKNALNQRFQSYGYAIVNVLVDDPQPSEEIRNAFDKVVASEREKEASINYAESYRIKKVGEAQAEAESIKLKSQAYIQSRIEIIQSMKKNLDISELELTYIISGIDYRDALRDIAKNGSLIVVPHTFSDVQSGIITAEILKNKKS